MEFFLTKQVRAPNGRLSRTVFLMITLGLCGLVAMPGLASNGGVATPTAELTGAMPIVPADEERVSEINTFPVYVVALIATALVSAAMGMMVSLRIRRPAQENVTSQPASEPPSTSVVPTTPSAPQTEAPAPAHSSSTPSKKSGPTVPEGCIETKILYVHDDPKGFKALEKELRRYCIDLIGTSDADTAYLACFSQTPKMVLVDAVLPGTTPAQVFKRLRQHPLSSDFITAVVAQQESRATLHEHQALEGVRCLEKPVDAEELMTELTRRTAICDLAPDCINQSTRYLEAADEKAEVVAANAAVPERNADRSETDSQAVQREAPASDGVPDGEKPRRPKVLCIDDDPHVSQAIMMRLRPLGVDVIRAFDGMQGFWTGLDTRPDVIITDLRMPDGEGNYILTRFQAHPLTKDVPVIVLTGETNPAVRRMMLAMGVSAYFTKPWNFDELRQELERHIDLCPGDSSPRVAVTT